MDQKNINLDQVMLLIEKEKEFPIEDPLNLLEQIAQRAMRESDNSNKELCLKSINAVLKLIDRIPSNSQTTKIYNDHVDILLKKIVSME